MGQPTIFPTGVTIYKPEKCWNGYNLVPTINSGALLFDMNGNEIRRWEIPETEMQNMECRIEWILFK